MPALFEAPTLSAEPALFAVPTLFEVPGHFTVPVLFAVTGNEVAEPTVDVGAVTAECNTALFIRIGL